MNGNAELRRLASMLPALLILLVLGLDALVDIPHQDAFVLVLAVLWVIAMLFWFPSSSDPTPDGYLSMEGRHEDSGIPNLKMTVTRDPDDLVNRSMVHFKVGQPPS